MTRGFWYKRCPKCGRMRQLTEHHVKGRKNSETIRICRDCHDEIHEQENRATKLLKGKIDKIIMTG